MSEEVRMKAIVQDEYGEAVDVLRLEEIDIPRIGDEEVLIRVQAAGVERGAWHLMAGVPYLVRLAGFGLRAPKNRVRGLDASGIVEKVGGRVTRLRPGDEVFGIAESSFAEYARAKEEKILRKPANLSFEQAAVLPISGITALQAVRSHGKVKPGESVLVIGASGGVGTFAVQIAKAEGAEVTGVCSAAKADLVRGIGADHVIDYQSEDFVEGGPRFDVVLDIAGNASLARLRRAMTPNGRLVIIGGEEGGRWLGGNDRQLRAMLLSPFVSQKLGAFVSPEKREDLQTLLDLVEAGKVTPVIDRSFSLAETASAIDHMQNGSVRGKVVITVG